MMNKKTMILFLLLTLLVLSGCGTDYSTFKKGIYHSVNCYGAYEWVSPDGVHYWVFNGTNKYGITPRYDSKGKLVISEKERLNE